MIELTELATKISNILNGLDSDTSSITNPMSQYTFKVATYGTQLDNIGNKSSKKNFIPVYIANQDGSIEPIPTLKNVSPNFDVYFYYPIKLKDELFSLCDFLIDCFVGKIMNYGTKSGYAVSNISIPSFGSFEAQNMTQFINWVGSNYGVEVNKTELWGVMQFKVYFNQVANLMATNGFVLGNQVDFTLSFNGYSENVVFADSSKNITTDNITQQGMSDYLTKSLTKNMAFTDGINVYVRDNAFWRAFLDLYENGQLQNTTFTLTKTYRLASGNKVYSRNLILSNAPSTIQLGVPLTMSFAFETKASV